MYSMPTADQLLSLATLLRQRHARPRRFNVFTVLHKPTDEVRLHSRFIAALLDPSAHELGLALLERFIKQAAISDFSLEGVRVTAEKQRIDILITNAHRQAILIENKLLAADQENQLVTYYQALRAQGYQQVHVVFLSLEGRQPAPHSLGNLAELGIYRPIAYREHVLPWLALCAEKAACHPPLRESIVQYHDLITQLTGQDMDTTHRDTLADTLLVGDNMLAAHDIRLAFDDALIRLQVQLWRDLEAAIAAASPMMASHLDRQSATCGNLLERCRGLMKPTNRTSVGLYYQLPDVPEAFVAAEMESNSIYLGIKCPKAREGYSSLCQILDGEGPMSGRNHLWPGFAYFPQDMNLRTPSAETLCTLTNEQTRQSLAQAMADEMLRLWLMATTAKHRD